MPLATDGWSTFHPPLFYALAALLAPIGASALHALPWISGLGSVFVAHSLAQRLLPLPARHILVNLVEGGVQAFRRSGVRAFR